MDGLPERLQSAAMVGTHAPDLRAATLPSVQGHRCQGRHQHLLCTDAVAR